MKAFREHNSFCVNPKGGDFKGKKKGKGKGGGGKAGGGKGDGKEKSSGGCKFMAKYGNCNKGDDCFFSHEPGAIAAYKREHPEYQQAWEAYSHDQKGGGKGKKGKKGKGEGKGKGKGKGEGKGKTGKGKGKRKTAAAEKEMTNGRDAARRSNQRPAPEIRLDGVRRKYATTSGSGMPALMGMVAFTRTTSRSSMAMASSKLPIQSQEAGEETAWRPSAKAKAKSRAEKRSSSMPMVPRPAGYQDFPSDPSFFRLNLGSMSSASAPDEDSGQEPGNMSFKEGFGTVEVFSAALESKHADYKAQGAARNVFDQAQLANMSALKTLNGVLNKELPWDTVLDDGSKKNLLKEKKLVTNYESCQGTMRVALESLVEVTER